MPVPEFPFDWKKYFVGEQDTYDCVPACVAMCARYWVDINSLDIPLDTTEWKNSFEKLKVHSPRGTNLRQLKSALKKITPKNKIGLKFRLEFVEHVTDLTKLFELDTPVPVILCYDRRMILQNANGPLHASLLHSVDTQRERVRVIDPALIYRTDPSTYDMSDFNKGWDETGKQIIIPYPTNFKLRVNTRYKEKELPLENYRMKK